MTGVSANSIVFADRPVRAAGHLLTEHLLEEWSVGSFAKDPPNATVSVLSKDGASVRDAVVELKIPHLEGDRLTFDVRVLEGDLAGADGPASVFVDIIGLPFTPLSFAGVARRTARRAYWYGAAAAAAAPYYPPAPIRNLLESTKFGPFDYLTGNGRGADRGLVAFRSLRTRNINHRKAGDEMLPLDERRLISADALSMVIMTQMAWRWVNHLTNSRLVRRRVGWLAEFACPKSRSVALSRKKSTIFSISAFLR